MRQLKLVLSVVLLSVAFLARAEGPPLGIATHGEQTPWISSTFFGDFVFRPDGEAATAEEDTTEDAADDEGGEPASIDLAGIYRVEGTNPSGSKYHGMVALAQDEEEFNFTWWIGKDVFRGSGHFAGKMLVVNWGDKTPVICAFGDEGALDGEWADGSDTARACRQRGAG